MKKKVHYANTSPHGWWVASYIERFEYEYEDKTNLKRRCLAWENTILIKASNRAVAYRKAEKLGKLSEGSEGWHADTGRKGVWRFEGLTSLLPIYEELEDGAEILWVEHAGKSVQTIQSLVRARNQLSVFDDSKA
ncbi:hypothetical protein BH10PLA2_BH10PLA2_20280 [soil metagenome]